MNCPEITRLIHAFVDDELDLSTALAVDEHLQACQRCAASYRSLQAVRSALAGEDRLSAAPESLRSRVLASVAGGGGEASGGWRWLRSPALAAAPGLAALALAGWLALGGGPAVPERAAADAVTRVVYHIASSDQAGAALRNLSNHLQADPTARVVIVAHNNGVDFLLRGARDDAGRPFQALVQSFRDRGVEFRVCNNTLVRRDIASAAVIPEATLVPSGIAEIGRLQSREGYVYMRM